MKQYFHNVDIDDLPEVKRVRRQVDRASCTIVIDTDFGAEQSSRKNTILEEPMVYLKTFYKVF